MKGQDRLVFLLAVIMVFLAGMVCAGDLEPPPEAVGPGGSPAGTMHTLDEIYNKLEILQRKMDFSLGILGRFEDLGDGTVEDKKTGLIWLKDANCFSEMNWEDANAAAAGLNDGECGLSDNSVEGDWRLPTILEWRAFVDLNYTNPVLCNGWGNAQWSEGDAFNSVLANVYWSSTEWEGGGVWAWSMSMTSGSENANGKTNPSYVWPVRAGN